MKLYQLHCGTLTPLSSLNIPIFFLGALSINIVVGTPYLSASREADLLELVKHCPSRTRWNIPAHNNSSFVSRQWDLQECQWKLHEALSCTLIVCSLSRILCELCCRLYGILGSDLLGRGKQKFYLCTNLIASTFTPKPEVLSIERLYAIILPKWK